MTNSEEETTPKTGATDPRSEKMPDTWKDIAAKVKFLDLCTWTWNGTWMERKSVQHMYSHYLGCDLVHFHVSRWVIELIWQPTIMVYFDPKNGHFWTPPDLEWDLERG